ncbi:putative nucleotidyltransferase-like protein [Humibacillus xanthopallidus]|uniref:Putative nucleotidyltransferase-like protein n=1 Tax=Humibacillus xanthopallidus TaxID=412689 RepID=A0A543PXM9_9MICO|nr:nucleotidyltransferase family protein [Humibacillus xanthopallidus]TQN48801.1 putative nucleotidyltransferase-like protein [Humibacillus xanthopallidus]
MSELPTIPVRLRVHLAHATVQAIAEEVGADILHIKGPAVDPALRPEGRASADADVLVHPAHLKRLLAGLERHGWQQVTTLRSGGLVEHSTNWYHGELGQVDVHLRFPGIQVTPEQAFDLLWKDRGVQEVAHRACVVPRLAAQRLVLLLHAARDMRSYADDVTAAWTNASGSEREEVRALARQFDAEVALAAATGQLEGCRDRPEYELWRLYADGMMTTSGFRRMRAEIKARPAGYRMVHVRVIAYAVSAVVRVPQRLTVQLARKPTMSEIRAGYVALLRRGADVVRPRTRL